MSESSEYSLEVEVRTAAGVNRADDTRERAADNLASPSQRGESSEPTKMEIKDLEDKSIVVPQRIREALEEAKDFGQFKERRTFRFLHLSSGEKDVLGDAIKKEAKKFRMNVECVGLDRKTNGGVDLGNAETMDKIKKEVENDEWDGLHSGFPCGSFSRARWNPGGPPPVRTSREMYGCSTNSVRQQEEADRGTLAAVWSSDLMRTQCNRADKRGIQRIATLENPPGTEGIEGSAWMLPEIQNE